MLEVTGLHVAYGGIQAVRSITFHVNQGETVALIGANGAGKTSTLKAISRIINMAGGDVHFCGEKIGRIPSHELIRQGIALVPEGRGIFGDLTVRENLLLGAFARRARATEAQNRDLVLALFPRLAERRSQAAATMSGGERQMLAIGRALMAKPKLLMLDEPSLGLAPLIVREIFRIIAELRRRGVSILLVEQNARAALQVADYAYVLETGQIAMQGPAHELADDPRVIEAYLGLGGKHQAMLST